MSRRGIERATIAATLAFLRCRCGVEVYGLRGMVIVLYRQHRATARRRAVPPRPPATITNVQFTTASRGEA